MANPGNPYNMMALSVTQQQVVHEVNHVLGFSEQFVGAEAQDRARHVVGLFVAAYLAADAHGIEISAAVLKTAREMATDISLDATPVESAEGEA